MKKTEKTERELFKEQFADKLKAEIQNSGYTQEKFAEQINISKDTLGAYLNKGKTNLPDAYILQNMCNVLGCTSEYLISLRDTNEMNISSELGLTHHAQITLRKWKQQESPNALSFCEILNNILFDNVKNFESFLFHLDKYVNDHLIFGANEHGTIEEILISNVDMSYYQTLHSYELNELFFLQLQMDLHEFKRQHALSPNTVCPKETIDRSTISDFSKKREKES